MKSYEGLVSEALAATVIDSATSYRWFHRPGAGLTKDAQEVITPEAARSFLVHNLKMQLYADFYCPGRARPAGESWEGFRPPPGRTPFLEELSDANSGRGSFEPGWRVRSVEADRLVVERDGLSLWASPDEVVPDATGEASVGGAVRVRLPKELFKLTPGFYMALGDEALVLESGPLVRLYWNLEPRGAAALVRMLTGECNNAGIPFRLKVLSQPEHYRRCDAGVLYFHQADYPQIAEIAERAHGTLAPDLRAATPALTKALLPGLGLAEDPGGRESFGTHRCLIVAEGMVRGYEGSATTIEDRLQVVGECFEEAGLRLACPFLNAGSRDRYVLAAVAT